MIGVGTLVSMVYVGYMVRVFSPHIGWLDRIFIPAGGQCSPGQTAGTDSWGDWCVVTVARMYGSGGNAVGEEVARMLGCPFYSRQIIDRTAEQMGYSPEFVAENEQNVSTARLWEMILADSSIPMSMNPSKDDAIYVSESRTIRELAHQGPCVIVGRLGNWVLRDNPRLLRVFVWSDKEFAVRQVMEKLHIGAADASAKIDRVNTGRANHCWHYTGHQWTDVSGYDLVLNTGVLGIDGAADAIISAVESLRKAPGLSRARCDEKRVS